MAKKSPKQTVEIKKVSGDIKMVKLAAIVANTAQSRGMGVLPTLEDMGYGIFEKKSIDAEKEALWPMLLGQTEGEDDQATATRLIREHEPELVKLADSRRTTGDLQPVGLLALEDDEYDVIFGMRRCLAAAFNHAAYQDPAEIEAKVFVTKLDETQLMLLSLKENNDRKEESPIDKAMHFKRIIKRTKMSPKDLGEAIGYSDQYVRSYMKLLDEKLQDKKLAIHNGQLSVDKALKLLVKRTGSGTGAGADRPQADGTERHRLPGAKGIIKIYEAGWKPNKMPQEEWDLWIKDDVRRFLAYKLGLYFTPFVEKPKPAGKAATEDKTIKVFRSRANRIMVALGKTGANSWDDEAIKEKLETIHNYLPDDWFERDEDKRTLSDDGLDRLLAKLLQAQADGTSVKVMPDKKKGKTNSVEEEADKPAKNEEESE